MSKKYVCSKNKFVVAKWDENKNDLVVVASQKDFLDDKRTFTAFGGAHDAGKKRFLKMLESHRKKESK